ncbi:MAG: imidazoleglycerol-phosphate dehydratase [Negativicutes bacterium]|nr:imidazoleglycerol-phosphate dehydratase [Negativicutes bacterium]
MDRSATVVRKSEETDIAVKIDLDGHDNIHINTGVPFFDHILGHFARRAGFDLTIDVQCLNFVDPHHVVEDCGVIIGQAIGRALRDRREIRRNATAFVPVDDALVMAVVDINGRPWLSFDVPPGSSDGQLAVGYDLVEEFLRAITIRVNLNIHIRLIHGKNPHHCLEGIMKAAGQALGEAMTEKRQGLVGI